MVTDPYSPSPELVEQQREWFGNPRHFQRDYLTAAVAYRNENGHPELVPYSQVRELVEAVERMECDCLPYAHLPEYADGRCARCAALAPFTQEDTP